MIIGLIILDPLLPDGSYIYCVIIFIKANPYMDPMGNISDIREKIPDDLRRNVRFLCLQSQHKVRIDDQCHMMPLAWNACRKRGR
jgi:hypothetical protein